MALIDTLETPRRVGVISTADGYFYGTALLSSNVPQSIQAAAQEWDGGLYAYLPGEPERTGFEAYLLPEDWNDADHEDGQNAETIAAVEGGQRVGCCRSVCIEFNADPSEEDTVEASLRSSIPLENGHRLDIVVGPEVIDGGPIAVTIAGTSFHGAIEFTASERLTDGSHFVCNDLSDWRTAIPSAVEAAAWSRIKTMIEDVGIDLARRETEIADA